MTYLFLTNRFFFLQDVALNQPAIQSSTFVMKAKAGNAVDGRYDTCAGTSIEQDPWWRVDLGSSLPVAIVLVHSSFHRQRGLFEIRVGEFRSL